jgi:hypothetical protein
MPLSLTRPILFAGGVLAALPGLAAAQTTPEPATPTATAPAPAACPKGYEALCSALSEPAPRGSGGLGSQAGTGGKSTVIVHPEAFEKSKNPQ